MQIAGTPRNPRYVGAQVRKDLLQVLQFLDVKDPDIDKLAMSFTTSLIIKSVWEEIDGLPDLYNSEADNL